MSLRLRHETPTLITDAAPSFEEEQARRRRTYSITMAIHIGGFALSYPLYQWQWWAGLVTVLVTGMLPWIAVIMANDAPRPDSCRLSRPSVDAPPPSLQAKNSA
ncbi:MAG: DUF3099 domain-containing protein [Pseudonocardiaceae bacterium]